MPRPKGLPKTGGRQKGAANKRTREIADRAATDGVLPLEYMLRVVVTREELAERAKREIAEAFQEWQSQTIEHRSNSAQDGDRSEPVAEADHPALPVPRNFARPSSFEAVPGVGRRSIPRRPRPVGSGWAG